MVKEIKSKVDFCETRKILPFTLRKVTKLNVFGFEEAKEKNEIDVEQFVIVIPESKDRPIFKASTYRMLPSVNELNPEKLVV